MEVLTFPRCQHLAAQRVSGSTTRHDRFSSLRESRAGSGSSPIAVAGGVCQEALLAPCSAVPGRSVTRPQTCGYHYLCIIFENQSLNNYDGANCVLQFNFD